MHPITIHPVDIAAETSAVTALLRRAFAGVAKELDLTEENCPHHVAFMTEQRLLNQLHLPEARCLGVRENGEWVGFVAVAPYGEGYEITRLAVAPEHRHRGYGRALMDAACRTARELGLEEIGLGMIDENTVLKRWYIAQGFIPEESFRPEGSPFTICPMGKKL